MDIVFGYSDRIIALHQGKVLADATPAEIRADERVVDMVIGRKHSRHATGPPHRPAVPSGEGPPPLSSPPVGEREG
jgi:ABC-type hemin transport system ATPase subunit